MTRMILDIKKNTDVKILVEIAEKLDLPYSIEDITAKGISEEKKAKIMKGVDISNYGDPSDWQRQTRADRKLNISSI